MARACLLWTAWRPWRPPSHGRAVPVVLPLPLGCKGRSERSADGCRLGADGRGDLARYGRPAWRAALARSGGRTLGADEYHAIRLVGPLSGPPAVGGGAIRMRLLPSVFL